MNAAGIILLFVGAIFIFLITAWSYAKYGNQNNKDQESEEKK